MRYAPVPDVTGRVHDLTGDDYAYTPRDGGAYGDIACWNNLHPGVGDRLLLRNPKASEHKNRSSRYRVIEVDHCWNVDPPTMWMAMLVFDPRPPSESRQD